MKKSFKLTHKPGQPAPLNIAASLPGSGVLSAESIATVDHEPDAQPDRLSAASVETSISSSPVEAASSRAPVGRPSTTRKTIEVPEDYFFRVKMHALQRRIKEKDMWAEILEEYFTRHPHPK